MKWSCHRTCLWNNLVTRKKYIYCLFSTWPVHCTLGGSLKESNPCSGEHSDGQMHDCIYDCIQSFIPSLRSNWKATSARTVLSVLWPGCEIQLPLEADFQDENAKKCKNCTHEQGWWQSGQSKLPFSNLAETSSKHTPTIEQNRMLNAIS